MLLLPSDPIRDQAPWQDPPTLPPITHTYTHTFTAITHPLVLSPLVSFPHNLGDGLVLNGGPGQTSGPWNKQAANVDRQDGQLEPAHAVCEWACMEGRRTKHVGIPGNASISSWQRHWPLTVPSHSLCIVCAAPARHETGWHRNTVPALHAQADFSRGTETHTRGG